MARTSTAAPFIATEWGASARRWRPFSYFVTPRFSIGGGYWAMWTKSEPPEGRCPAPEQNKQYKTERFGVLFQGAYKWDESSFAVLK